MLDYLIKAQQLIHSLLTDLLYEVLDHLEPQDIALLKMTSKEDPCAKMLRNKTKIFDCLLAFPLTSRIQQAQTPEDYRTLTSNFLHYSLLEEQ